MIDLPYPLGSFYFCNLFFIQEEFQERLYIKKILNRFLVGATGDVLWVFAKYRESR